MARRTSPRGKTTAIAKRRPELPPLGTRFGGGVPSLDPITRRRRSGGRRPKPVFISGAFGGRGGRRPRPISPVAVTRPIRQPSQAPPRRPISPIRVAFIGRPKKPRTKRPPRRTGGSDFNVLQPFGRPTTTRDRRPSRVTVPSPSGREGRLISVSSRSILARGRKKKTKRRGKVPRKESKKGFGKRTAFVKGRGARREAGKLTKPRPIRVPRNGTPIIGTATVGRPFAPRARQGGITQITQFIDRARPTQRRVSIPFREPIPFMPFQESIRGRRGAIEEEEEERPRRRRAPPRRRRQSDFDLGNIFDVQF